MAIRAEKGVFTIEQGPRSEQRSRRKKMSRWPEEGGQGGNRCHAGNIEDHCLRVRVRVVAGPVKGLWSLGGCPPFLLLLQNFMIEDDNCPGRKDMESERKIRASGLRYGTSVVAGGRSTVRATKAWRITITGLAPSRLRSSKNYLLTSFRFIFHLPFASFSSIRASSHILSSPLPYPAVQNPAEPSRWLKAMLFRARSPSWAW